MLEVVYHRAKFGRAPITPAAWAANNVEFCLSVCLFVTVVNVRDCAHDFAKKALEYRSMVFSCAPLLNVLRLLTTADTTKCPSPKNGKDWGFSPPEGDRINRSIRNLARKRK